MLGGSRDCVTQPDLAQLMGVNYIASRPEESNMITDEIKQVVKSRYGKFAEIGSHKESC
jgi:hypothetical protein